MKNSIVILFLILLFTKCTPSDKSAYTVEGTVPDSTYNGKIIHMMEYEYMKIVDSAKVIDGKFIFSGLIDTASIRRLMIDRLHANFILEKGNIFIDMSKEYGAKVTLLNEGLSEFMLKTEVLDNQVNKAYSEIENNEQYDRATKQPLLNDIIKNYRDQYYALSYPVFIQNNNNTLGTYILWYGSGVMNVFSLEQTDSLYAQSGDIIRNNKNIQLVMQRNEGLKKTQVGNPFIDFAIPNGTVDGNKASLSDYVGKGKYVLVDFWASWCRPCMEEMPVIKEVYDKYKDEKFEVVGIAVMSPREKVLEKMKLHNMTWQHIIDDNSVSMGIYGIDGVPHIMLFSPDGTILARDLHGEGLKSKVAEVLK